MSGVRSNTVAAGEHSGRARILPRIFGKPSAVPTVPLSLARSSLGQHAIVADTGTLAGGQVAMCAASIQGLSHQSGAATRQDSYAFSTEPGRIAVAVADGLGSAPLSHVGSETAARTAVTVAAAGGNASEVAAAVSAALQLAADRQAQPVELFATTLGVLLIDIGEDDGPWQVQLAEWGDTRASVYRPGRVKDGHPDWERLTSEDVNELYANSVRPLPQYRKPRAGGSYLWMPGEMLMLATDGIDSHLVSTNPVGHGLATAWESMPTIWQFIADVGFDRAGARDDRTAFCLFRAAPAKPTGTEEDGRMRPGVGTTPAVPAEVTPEGPSRRSKEGGHPQC
ncbi:serine/threonine protein phosphatase PrpC [Arthrobacter pascens]|uniref:protein phosphatase 2C domain-containing protein n=1 Tax=Arthrobacter pascens TaxID=1677 RepID=UPI00277FF989|nr:protein phosphatase 2C domain-containing protein [Arthrobacter pascens]MDQ0633699.1 serine/threonine protein phosphatase PrpC [Arthrobacter pascens]